MEDFFKTSFLLHFQGDAGNVASEAGNKSSNSRSENDSKADPTSCGTLSETIVDQVNCKLKFITLELHVEF